MARLFVVGRVALEDVIGVEQGFLNEAPNVVAVGEVEDAGSFAAGAHEATEAQLGEVLRYGRRSSAEMVGKLVDRVLPMEQRPHDPQTGRVGDHGQHLDGPTDLPLRRILCFLRSHADNATASGVPSSTGGQSEPSWLGQR